MSLDNYIIVEQYFDYKEHILSLEEKNKDLENRIKQLEKIILKKQNKSVYQKVYNTYETINTYYEKIKMINIIILCIFGNRLLYDPSMIKKIFYLFKQLVL